MTWYNKTEGVIWKIFAEEYTEEESKIYHDAMDRIMETCTTE
jgi:hypothetical protein